MTTVKISLIQMNVVADKQANLEVALQEIAACARQGAQIVSLPGSRAGRCGARCPRQRVTTG